MYEPESIIARSALALHDRQTIKIDLKVNPTKYFPYIDYWLVSNDAN